MNRIKTLLKIIFIYISKKYATKVANEYWQNTTITHGSMSEDSFDFYYTQLFNIMNVNNEDKILDFGGGNGEISYRFKKNGFNIEHCDISIKMVENAKNKGLTTHIINDEFFKTNKKFNKIVLHGSFLYIHPKEYYEILKKISNLLEVDGRIYITDNPDFDKIDKCYCRMGGNSKIALMILKFFPVYDVKSAGFFIKDKDINNVAKKINLKTKKIDSWANYRSHWILAKK